MKRFSLGFATGLIVCLVFITTSLVLADNPIKLIINGKTIAPDVAPVTINGRIMVPARFVAEPLGATVEWDRENQSIIITSPTTKTDAVKTVDKTSEVQPIIEQEKLEQKTSMPEIVLKQETGIMEKYVPIRYCDFVDNVVVNLGTNPYISKDNVRMLTEIIDGEKIFPIIIEVDGTKVETCNGCIYRGSIYFPKNILEKYGFILRD